MFSNLCEQFNYFVEVAVHAAVTKLIDSLGVDISSLRGQSYDNASNMSGIYTGLQSRIWKLSPLALYVPCVAHSLNLVGSCAACSCLAATSYFAFLQSLYTFFSASTYRWHWQMLTDALPPHGLVVKSLSDSRWSARADATRSAFAHYREVLKVATDTCADTKQSPDTITVGWWTGQADGAVGNCANDSCLAYYFGAFKCDIFVTAESLHWFALIIFIVRTHGEQEPKLLFNVRKVKYRSTGQNEVRASLW